MLTGKTIEQFGAEIDRQRIAKRDFLEQPTRLEVTPRGSLVIPSKGEFAINDYAHGQIANTLGYPSKFWHETRRQFPEQWANLTNAMLKAQPEGRRMIRTLDGNTRAYLSNAYRPIDNHQVAAQIFRVIRDRGGEWQIAASEVTDSELYIKVLTPKIKDVKVGDPVQMGFMIKNSEVGRGAFAVSEFIYRLRCTNGAVGETQRRNHTGERWNIFGSDPELYSEKTRRLSDATFISGIGDMIARAVDDNRFERLVEMMGSAEKQPITGKLDDVIEVAREKFGLTEDESSSVLSNLANNKEGLNRFAFANAITYTAHANVTDFERSTELEEIGGKVLMLDASQWNRIAEGEVSKKK